MFKEPVKIIVFLLLVAFWTSLLVTKMELPQGNDLGRHVKNGELILHGHFEALYSNVYTYTMPNYPTINHHWLSGVLFYIVQSTTGWEGLVIFKIAVLLAAFVFVFLVAAKKSNFWLAALFSIPTIFMLAERIAVRPEIFSIFLTALFLYILTRFEENPKGKILYWLIPLELVWMNLHICFIYGIALTGLFIFVQIIHQFRQRKPIGENEMMKKLWIVLGLQIIVCIFNPNGIKGVLYPFSIINTFGFEVMEMEPLSYFLKYYPLNENVRVIICIASVALLALSFLINIKRTNVFYLVLSVLTAYGAITVLRGMPFFALVFLPAVCINFKNIFEKVRILKSFMQPAYRAAKYSVVGVLTLALVLLVYEGATGKILFMRIQGLGLTEQSMNAANFFKSEGLKGPIFNDYDIGGYLIYSLYPAERVFTDNRPEAYSASFFLDGYYVMLQDEETWHKADAKYHFNVLFFEQYDLDTRVISFLNRRVADSTWALVYADRYAMMFVRNTAQNQKTIAAHAITLQNAGDRLAPLLTSDDYHDQITAVDILNFIGRPDLGMMASFDMVTRWPHLAKVWKSMGQNELSARGDYTPILAMMFLDKAISEGQRTADAYTALAAAFIKLNKMDRAKEALEKAIKINPEYQEAKSMMAQYFKN